MQSPLKVAMPSGAGGVGTKGLNMEDKGANNAGLNNASEAVLLSFAAFAELSLVCELPRVGKELDRTE
jgi:hypothetical protein